MATIPTTPSTGLVSGRRPRARFLLAAVGGAFVIGLVPNSATWPHSWTGWWAVWLFGAGLAVAIVSGAVRIPGPKSFGAFLLPVIATLVAAAMAADQPIPSWASLAAFAPLIATAVLASALSSDSAERLPPWISAGGLVVSAVALWRWAMQDVALESITVQQVNGLLGSDVFPIQWTETRNGHPFGHQNYLAGFLLLTLPFWLAELGAAVRWRRLVGLAGLVVGIVALGSTMTRAALPALAGMLVLILAWTGWRRVWAVRRWALWLLGGSAVVTGLFLANPRTQMMLDQGQGVSAAWQTDVRQQMLQAGLRLLEGRAALGIGPGNVASEYPRVRGALAAGLESNYQLHNTPLQLAVETGWIGLGTVLVLGLASVARWWRLAPGAKAGELPVAFWAGVGFLGYAAYSLSDYQLDVVTISSLVGLCLGLLWAQEPTNGATEASGSRFGFGRSAAIASVLLLAGILGAGAWQGRARARFHEAVAAVRQGDAVAFDALAEAAHRLDPKNPFYPEKLGAWHVEALVRSTNSAAADLHRAKAIRWLEATLEAEPDAEYAHFNLAWLKLESAPDAALRHFHRAAHLVPDRKGVYWGSATALAALGHAREAAEALALELMLDPGWLQAPSPWLREPFPELRSNAVEHARQFLDTAAHETGAPWLRQKADTLGWLARHPVDSGEGRIVHAAVWRALTIAPGGDEPPVSADSAPWELVRAAWRSGSAGEKRRLLIQASYRSTRKVPAEERLRAWVERVSLDSWAEVVRAEPAWELLSGYRRQRSGYNLIARHAEGAKPADLPNYEENTFYETFFAPLAGLKSDVPSPFFLRELDRIVDPVLKP